METVTQLSNTPGRGGGGGTQQEFGQGMFSPLSETCLRQSAVIVDPFQYWTKHYPVLHNKEVTESPPPLPPTIFRQG